MTSIMQERLTAVRQKLTEWDIDALLITNANNYRWLSGFTGSACTLLISDEQALLGTDFRYWEQAQQQAPDYELVKMGRGEEYATVHDMAAMADAKKIGVEGNHITVNQFRTLQEKEESLTWVPLDETVEGMRLIKTTAELEKIRAAATITDWAMAQVNQLAKIGMSEKALAWELEKAMRERGAEGMAFEVIVASGPNAALAHHRPSERRLQAGDSIVVDMGAKLDGYHSDLTRSFHMGTEPDEKFWFVYNLVLKAQKNALQNMKAGQKGQEIDALARDIIAEAGHKADFGHSLGHGVGLEIHENPSLSWINEKEIPAGCVVTVEPGVYLSGWGGVRIEDLVVLGEDGVEFLSHCPKNPLVPLS
ncbi:MAG: aminopeptidase P family protein [Anaerolineales bacterium]|nr:aminopeptidase P family protein [Anaerolineales bacterium]